MKQTEFNMLYTLKKNPGLKQREIAKKCNISVGNANQTLATLKDSGLVSDSNTITDNGIAALKPYKVDNAVIMAAGVSSRFAPLSYEKPKGLLKVHGEILIERQIEQLREAGIHEIILVVGYMKETFFYLAEKYGINIVINEDYFRYNNPSTLIRVLDKLGNTYICSSDDYFSGNVFEEYVYQAYYAAKFGEGKTQEYCITSDRHDRITKVTIGGENMWYMLGHVYFDRAFSEKFKPILEEEFSNPSTRGLLWEDLYMKHIKELDMYIQRYGENDIYEFDSLDELREFDPHYINNTDSRILKNICSVLKCTEEEIVNILPIKQGLTNLSFQFEVRGNRYMYRHPGVGTEEYINRSSEAFSEQVASELGLDDTFIYMDQEAGWKISRFVDNARTLDYHNPKDVEDAMNIIRKLHRYPKKSNFDFDIWEKTEEFIHLLAKVDRASGEDFRQLHEIMKTVHDYVAQDKVETCICHCDCYDPNFLIDEGGKMYLIDWEYSGNSDPSSDLGTFICCSDYTYEEALDVIRLYFENQNLSERDMRHTLGCVALASYYWFVWAIFQESNGNAVGEYLLTWYNYSKKYAKETIKLYKEEKSI